MTDAATRSSAAPPPEAPRRTDRLVRIAAVLALVGFSCALLFLIFGFESWSVGLGVFLGFPVLLAAVLCYVVAVVRDLRAREAL